MASVTGGTLGTCQYGMSVVAGVLEGNVWLDQDARDRGGGKGGVDERWKCPVVCESGLILLVLLSLLRGFDGYT